MNKPHPESGPRRKRKPRKRSKGKKMKRPKLPTAPIFQETQFDSTDDSDSSVPTPNESLIFQFENIMNLTPSKSECETLKIVSEPEVVVSNNESDVSCVLSESRLDDSSDDDESYSYSSIFEEFFTAMGAPKETEVVSAPVEVPAPPKDKKTQSVSSSVKKVAKLLFDPVECYHQNEGVVAVLEKHKTVYCHGLCLLTVLHGKVEVLGHVLTRSSPPARIYSPRGSSLLYLKNITVLELPVIDNFLLKSGIKFKDKSAVILCTKLQDESIFFIEKHISQVILPKVEPPSPRIVFQPKEGSWNLLTVDNEVWDSIIDPVGPETKLMICGGKGVGKTTFLRYSINRLLMKFKEVRVIDLDPGQSEFTVPGCISIVRVTEPVFGVNYTHLRPAERSILTNINIAYDPAKYLSSVKQLLTTHLDDIPTLVNYMGYTHGLGVHILSAVITLIKPTDVLQIKSQDSKKNYKVPLRERLVEKNAELLVDVEEEVVYNLYHIRSQADDNDSWIAQSRQLREMCVLSHLSGLVECNSIGRPKAPIYRIKLSEIKISDLNGEKVHPVAVNASMVALARLDNEKEGIFECLGWGLVRGVDLTEGIVAVQTCQKLPVLDKVTHFVSNGGTLPPSLFMTPDQVDGPMPYVMNGTLTALGQIPKRSRQSMKSKDRILDQ